MTSNKHDDYLLIAAIRFGTKFSGYVFSTGNDESKCPAKAYLKQWTCPYSLMKSDVTSTSTCVLFSEGQQFQNFGLTAEVQYLYGTSDFKDWYFFRNFETYLNALQVMYLSS
jgi:hypothetical protein